MFRHRLGHLRPRKSLASDSLGCPDSSSSYSPNNLKSPGKTDEAHFPLQKPGSFLVILESGKKPLGLAISLSQLMSKDPLVQDLRSETVLLDWLEHFPRSPHGPGFIEPEGPTLLLL